MKLIADKPQHSWTDVPELDSTCVHGQNEQLILHNRGESKLIKTLRKAATNQCFWWTVTTSTSLRTNLKRVHSLSHFFVSFSLIWMLWVKARGEISRCHGPGAAQVSSHIHQQSADHTLDDTHNVLLIQESDIYRYLQVGADWRGCSEEHLSHKKEIFEDAWSGVADLQNNGYEIISECLGVHQSTAV